MKTIIGLDVSSKTIGWSVITIDAKNNLKKKASGYIKPIKTNDPIYNIASTRDKIIDLFKKYKPDYIGIEDIIKFMKGGSTATTIITLTTFNRMISLAAYDYLGESPNLFNVLSIRHGIKIENLPKKEEIPELVSHHLNYKFDYELDKNGNKREENFDEADGIAVGLYLSFLL